MRSPNSRRKRAGPIITLAASAQAAESLYDDLAFFLGEERGAPLRKRLHLLPSWEVLPFEKLSPHPENLAARLEGLYKLVEESAPILMATPAALMQKVIPKEALKQSYLIFGCRPRAGSRKSLLEHLVQWGYPKCSFGRGARRFQRARRHCRSVFARLLRGRCGLNSTAIV